MSARAVLTDAHHDLLLRRDGFVCTPLLDPPTVDRLREAYGRIHGWDGAGFEADLTNPDSAYRARVNDLLIDTVEPLLAPHFRDHRPFLGVFLAKHPGAGSELNLHQDWMYVDERSGRRTYVVWIALDDVTPENGPIQVLRHSHRLATGLRGTDLNAAWLLDDSVPERMLTVPVRAGDAIVMDNALVHGSPANRSTRPRLAAAVGMRPSTSPLVHFRRAAPSSALRYDIDESFFVSVTPQDLFGAPPPTSPVEQIDLPPADGSAADNLARLGSTPLAGLDRLRRRAARGVRPAAGRRGA